LRTGSKAGKVKGVKRGKKTQKEKNLMNHLIISKHFLRSILLTKKLLGGRGRDFTINNKETKHKEKKSGGSRVL